MNRRQIFLILLSFVFISCSDEPQRLENDRFLLSATSDHTSGSTVEGNLISTAIKEVHDLDMVFYPSRLLQKNRLAFLSSEELNASQSSLLQLFPEGPQDQFMVGSMLGRHIKSFILDRSRLNFDAELQVAGVHYHVHFVGGWPEYSYFSRPGGIEIKDNELYRVAISDFYYFSGSVFPGYKYGNFMSLRSFSDSKIISARESLKEYLQREIPWPFFREQRAKVTNEVIGDAGRLSIAQIRGPGHRSPHRGKRVITSGVVTAQGTQDTYPGGEEAYIQTPEFEGHPHISDAIHIRHHITDIILSPGDLIEVEGVIYDQQFSNGRARTSIQDITRITILKQNQPLPPAVRLGVDGLPIPNKYISRWVGNIFNKTQLDLDEGVDFWKALEGMRVRINNPRIVGFRGGNENDFEDFPKRYLNLYVVADGERKTPLTAAGGGVVIDQKADIFNPEIIQIQSNHFTQEYYIEAFYDVGKIIEGELEGIAAIESNIFGDGEHVLFFPTVQEPLRKFARENKEVTPLEERPITTLTAGPRSLTVATYNVENLAASQGDRFDRIGRSIGVNLRCPDIIAFTEIQESNAVSYRGDGNAEKTMQKIIDHTHPYCEDETVNYASIHVPPFLNNDGGQPGGNIQVAYLYNQTRVSFTPRGNPDSIMDVYIRPDGSFRDNPIRLFSEDRIFRSTRKSLAAEFEFQGERLFLIGNHLNSKLGDDSLWGPMFPQDARSDNRRQQMTREIHLFARKISQVSPDSHVIILGDFNAFTHDDSMKILAGGYFQNLTTYRDLNPFNNRYSYNFNGKSQQIDHIFVGPSLLKHSPEFEIPHINTDFMGRIADHDPVISRFTF